MKAKAARQVCQTYISQQAVVIPEHASKKLLGGYGIPTPPGVFVPTAAEAPAAAAQIGYPVVVKVASTTLLHKTERQAVRLNITDDAALIAACRAMQAQFSRRGEAIDGFLVEKMLPAGTEFIVGLQNDPQFGPVVMLGTGGTLIHLLDDVTFRPLPVNRADIVAMMGEIKGRKLIDGHRGQPPLSAEALIRAIAAVARFGCDAAGLYQSVDLNPVVVDGHTAVALDAKIVLAERAEEVSLESEPPRTDHLEKFFQPQRVALLGASTTPGKIGYAVADSLINHEYKGTVYPVTLGGKAVFGQKSYPSLEALPAGVDLAVVVVGLTMVPDILDQCQRLGIDAVLIISGGGKELGGAAMQLEQTIQRKAREHGIRVIGPNCIGCFDAHSRFDAFFQTHERMTRPPGGNIAFITQSGTYGCSFMEAFEHIGINKMISYGNRVEVDEADMIAFLAEDDRTQVLAAYVEGFGDGRKFLQTARSIIRRHAKPIVVYKSGRSRQAAQAAQSHTGAYGGSYGVCKGAFNQAGILTVDTFEELVAAAKALSMQPPARGPAIAMISNGAGPMVNAMDLFDRHGLTMATISPDTIKKMEAHYPSFYICKNPVDVTGSATSADYLYAMERLVDDPGVDIIMNWFVFQDTPLDEGIVDALAQIQRRSKKPILCGASGGPYTRKLSLAIEAVGVPVFESAHLWVVAASILAKWGQTCP
ncbi:putative CoA-binding domain protein [Desulfosarcina cetonica]|nr:putative CoA-binding domain protein [Desulfosarcina cetonica]